MNSEEGNTYGEYYDSENRKQFQVYMQTGRIIADIIYERAVQLHEENEKYDVEIKYSILAKIKAKVPQVFDFPILSEYYDRTIDRICAKKENIPIVIYNQVLDRIKTRGWRTLKWRR